MLVSQITRLINIELEFYENKIPFKFTEKYGLIQISLFDYQVYIHFRFPTDNEWIINVSTFLLKNIKLLTDYKM